MGGGASPSLYSILVSVPLIVPYGVVVKQESSVSAAYYFDSEQQPSATALFSRLSESCDMFVGQLQIDLVSFCCKKAHIALICDTFNRLSAEQVAAAAARPLPPPIRVACVGLQHRPGAAGRPGAGSGSSLCGASSVASGQSGGGAAADGAAAGGGGGGGSACHAGGSSGAAFAPAFGGFGFASAPFSGAHRVFYTKVVVDTHQDRKRLAEIQAFVERFLERLREARLIVPKSVIRTPEMLVVVRRFMNEPLSQPLASYDRFRADNVQLSEVRLVFSKGTNQCPVRHVKVDPRFVADEISCRPIVCDSTGAPARYVFASCTLPRVERNASAALAYLSRFGEEFDDASNDVQKFLADRPAPAGTAMVEAAFRAMLLLGAKAESGFACSAANTMAGDVGAPSSASGELSASGTTPRFAPEGGDCLKDADGGTALASFDSVAPGSQWRPREIVPGGGSFRSDHSMPCGPANLPYFYDGCPGDGIETCDESVGSTVDTLGRRPVPLRRNGEKIPVCHFRL